MASCLSCASVLAGWQRADESKCFTQIFDLFFFFFLNFTTFVLEFVCVRVLEIKSVFRGLWYYFAIHDPTDVKNQSVYQ